MIHTIAYRIALYTSLTVVGIVLWFFLSFMLLVLIFLASVLSLIALMFILFFIGAPSPWRSWFKNLRSLNHLPFDIPSMVHGVRTNP